MDFEPPEWLSQIEGILETLNEGVIIADDCPQIIFANANFEEMTGIPRSDFIGSNFDRFFTPEEAEILNTQRQRGMQAGHNRFEFVLPRHDGSRLPVIVSARSIEDPDGRRFAIVTFTDISEQKRAEGNLRTANTLLEERQKEIEEDLVLAARVQQSLAPKSLVWGTVHVETYYHPVRTIGGDFGLVTPLNDDSLNLLVCDVSGHGIGSALVANRIYAETMTQLRNGAPLATMLRQLNRFVMHNIGSSVFFFTIAAAQLD
ncbi:MAG: PAS domain S-box protein, partial [Candidatus Acidiferrales bacterium]